MSEAKTEVAPIKVREAENRLTPEQRVMSKARSGVMSQKDVLGKVGVSKETVQEAAKLAGEEAKAEFEKQQETNPLYRLQAAVARAAETEDEQILLTERTEAGVSYFIDSWRSYLIGEKKAAGVRGEELNIHEAIRQTRRGTVDMGLGLPVERNGIDHPYFEFLRGMQPKDKFISVSEEFMARVLRELGVFKESHKLDDLRSLPHKKVTEEGPRSKPEWDGHGWQADRITIPGFEGIDIGFKVREGKVESAWVTIDPKTLESQVIQLPDDQDLSFDFG